MSNYDDIMASLDRMRAQIEREKSLATPGPWKSDPRYIEDLVHTDGCSADQAEANARLIAAAPEMLGLLQEVEGIFANGFEDVSECMHVWSRISDVVCKASGKGAE